MDDMMKNLAREVEQSEAGASATANIVAIFFHELVKRQLTRKEALSLTQVWLASSLGNIRKT